ncbi:[protein-PII] uridylyltransferase [Streptomyces catenulae]|uniref:Bifunctional uridylyltransferase/uridylyl-removing enzyme n=1 Tax=Streptomyces catenulae TaxID=66875 RepID=A0ABV2YUP4_9ACTN
MAPCADPRPGSGSAPRAAPGPAPCPAPSAPSDDYSAARLCLLGDVGVSGPERRAALARITDGWLGAVFADAVADTGVAGAALVAVGGYGRGELSPRSDLDLLLLHDGRAAASDLAALADRLWYPVWDHGLALDHSVRTPARARAAARADLKVQLGLLDARHLAGDRDLTDALRTTAAADWRAAAPARLPELHALGRARAARHGDLRYLLEPDLKEARGGLRDATALRAVAASWLADAPRDGLEAARGSLLDIRDALHLATGRATDRLTRQEQDQVAAALGLPDADALLRRVHEAARTLAYATDTTWRETDRILRARSVRPVLRTLLTGGRAAARGERTPLAEGVVVHDGEAALARTARPERDPVLGLRAAAAAARAGLPLSRHAARRCATAYAAHPLPVPWPAEAREAFVTLLDAGAPTVPVWETLEAEGLLTLLLPEWERVRCLPQRNAVHTWTVDRHLVETAVRAAALTRRVDRPDLLLVAALLHDLGKGLPGDHAVAGVPPARAVAARLGFGARDTAVLATLVRHHLLLVETATRRDLDDPETVTTVAAAVGTARTLGLLHALTEADARATGPAAWSAWRAALVDGLVARVAERLAGAPVPDGPATRAPTAEEHRLAAEAARTGDPALTLHTEDTEDTEDTAHGAAGAGPPHGAAGAGPPDGAPDEGRTPGPTPGPTEAATGPMPGGPMQRPAPGPAEPDTGGPRAPEPVGAALLLAVPADRGPDPASAAPATGVLAAAAGVLALHRITVRAADLRTLHPDGPRPIALLTWRIAAHYGALPPVARLRADLIRALDGTLDLPARLAARERAARPHAPAAPPPTVTVAPGTSRTATVVDVRARDAHGLLHRICRALESAGAAVRAARVCTLGTGAVDAFYLTDGAGAPLTGERADAAARAVRRALD